MLQLRGRVGPRGDATPSPRIRSDLVLRVVGGPFEGRERPIPRDRPFTLGRSEEADFEIIDSKISRIHCRVEFREGEWVLEDLQSRNGTWVGEKKVKRHSLADGDVFLLGRTTAVKAILKEPRAVAGARGKVVFPPPSREPEPIPVPVPESLPPLTGALAGLPGTNLGEFRVLDQVPPLGRAAFFRALQPSLNRHVLVEVFTDEEVSRSGGAEPLQAAVRQAGRALHPNILQIFDFGAARGFTYVTMEFFQGRNLGHLLAAKGFVPMGQALSLGRALCEAFGAAIDSGVPAGTVSPSDVWVTADFAPKVKFLREPGSPPPPPADFAYQAPEVLAGGDAASPRAAVYTAGAILYHMLAATPPLAGASREEIARRARHDTPTPLRRVNIKVNALLARVVEQALAKDPGARPETLRDLARDLQRSTTPTL